MCSTRAALEGRVSFCGRCLRAKKSRHVSFTLLTVVDRSHMMTTNSSCSLIIFVKLSQGKLKNLNISLTFSKEFQACQAVFYSFQQMLTLYHNLWIHERMAVIFYLGPNDLTISWIGIHRKSLLFPNVVHNSTTFKSSKTTTSIRTTSASEPIILIDLIPPKTTCFSLHVGTYKGHLF